MKNLIMLLLILINTGRYSSDTKIKTKHKTKIEKSLAPLDIALTFSHIEKKNKAKTFLIIKVHKKDVYAIDLNNSLSTEIINPLEILNKFGKSKILELAKDESLVEKLNLDDLTTHLSLGHSQIAAGGNYKEHGDEAGLEKPFLFPKFSNATRHNSHLIYSSTTLLDYEVEICAKFDRDIYSINDFHEANKGFFLCGDHSDRDILLRKIDIKNIESGIGFTDAKSGKNRFPVGPFFVVPNDWRQFLNSIQIELYLNDKLKQNSTAKLMVMKLDEIISRVLKFGIIKKWKYKDQAVSLIKESYISKDQTILVTIQRNPNKSSNVRP